MNNKYTLKELADIGAKAANSCLPEGVRMCVLSGSPPHHVVARQAFTKAILDAIGYEFPKDAEREAFDAWWKANRIAFCNEEHAFQLWKAGREELRQAINKPSYSTLEQIEESIQNLTTKEPAWILDKQPVVPAWIPWYGGDKSPIVGEQTRYEVECRSGARNIWNTNFLRWSHDGSLGDIMAYRILDSEQCEKTKTETAWIPWNGSYKSPIVGKQTKFEVKYRDGVMQIYTQNNPLCWRHDRNFSDIIAYRILD